MHPCNLLLNNGLPQPSASGKSDPGLVEKCFDIFSCCQLYPYSSAAFYYVYNGISPPDKLGTDCVGQAEILKQKLHELSITAKYIEDTIVGRHRSLLCEVDCQQYYMSPYLLHQYPVPLNKATLLVLPTFPVMQGQASKLFITKTDNILEVKKTWLNSSRVDRFCFDLNISTSMELTQQEWMRRLIHPEQKTISIRVLDPLNGEVLHYLINIENLNGAYVISSNGASYKQSEEFNRVLKRIAELTDSAPSEIEDYIFGALALRHRLLSD